MDFRDKAKLKTNQVNDRRHITPLMQAQEALKTANINLERHPKNWSDKKRADAAKDRLYDRTGSYMIPGTRSLKSKQQKATFNNKAIREAALRRMKNPKESPRPV